MSNSQKFNLSKLKRDQMKSVFDKNLDERNSIEFDQKEQVSLEYTHEKSP